MTLSNGGLPERLRTVKYACLSYIEEGSLDAMLDGQWKTLVAATRDYEAVLREGGHFVDSQFLHPAESAATVWHRRGRTTVMEGSFAETRLHLAGFVLIEAEDLNQAIQLASKIPSARHGCIEVRPIHEDRRTP